MTLRVRFAPSPTGFLHVGGARTALFNWLLARKEGGTFILRIEDTDRERSSEEMTRAILEGMSWLGLDWDEGPFFQSEGLERHRAAALRLLKEDRAYLDLVSPEELARVREEDPGRALRYPREQAEALPPGEAAERAAEGEPHAIRFRIPDGETAWVDRVHGEVRFRNPEIEDLVILRADGTPTYNLAVVSDDAEHRVTLVIRGDDHISNTPKQILLHEALGHLVPDFAHVPMILGPDGKRLSKRHGATAVGEYHHQGILPGAMANFLTLLGWNPGTEEEIFTPAELVEVFSLERVQKKSAVFDPKKLEWLNGQHLSRTPARTLAGQVLDRLGELRTAADIRMEGDPGWFEALVDLLKTRARSVDDIADQARPYLSAALIYDDGAVAKHWMKDPATALGHLEALRDRLGALSPAEWTEEGLETDLRSLAEARGVGAGKLIHPLRVALTGQGVSPGIFEVLGVMGRETSLERIEAGIRRIREAAGSASPEGTTPS
jgi:glutamyl-tRNA synthetase